jgi:hypothetical protein
MLFRRELSRLLTAKKQITDRGTDCFSEIRDELALFSSLFGFRLSRPQVELL